RVAVTCAAGSSSPTALRTSIPTANSTHPVCSAVATYRDAEGRFSPGTRTGIRLISATSKLHRLASIAGTNNVAAVIGRTSAANAKTPAAMAHTDADLGLQRPKPITPRKIAHPTLRSVAVRAATSVGSSELARRVA